MRETKIEREGKILDALFSSPRRFNELHELTSINTASLTTDLRRLMKEDKIEKKYDEFKDGVVYCLKNEERYRRHIASLYAQIIGVDVLYYHEFDKSIDICDLVKKILENYDDKKDIISKNKRKKILLELSYETREEF